MLSTTVRLGSGFEMPLVGYGTWKIPNNVCADQIYNAIKAGYRLIDGACDYGNEKECGEGVRRAIDEGIVKREDLFIVSKLWQTYHEKEHVEPICRRMLADWGIEYFDLFIMHFPVALKYVDPAVRYPPGWTYTTDSLELKYSDATIQETWQAMEALVDKRLCRSLGVSNFSIQNMMELQKYNRHPISTLQIEHHPYLTQRTFVEWAQRQGIQVTAYSSFGPQGFQEIKGMDGLEGVELLFNNKTINAIAKKHNMSAPQVLLRWSTQRGIAVIPKGDCPEHLAQNMENLNFKLDDEDIEAIFKLNANLRFNNPPNYGFDCPIFA
ncbi:hypothetical protein KEM56_003635 [Ascosphaera pollenicola]|nr:hypothetical protein KEM56_003635 [Ascosphaera pollenicola]